MFAAITPLARDLTTHMGKGMSRQAARVSAVMEAIERVSAEEVPGKVIRASIVEQIAAGRHFAAPEGFDLPPGLPFRPEDPVDWVDGWDLMAGARDHAACGSE